MAKRESKLASKIPIDMTAMIDVVFQLLTFFMLTLKSVIVEGDFNIRMPLGASAGAADDLVPPIVIKMSATPEGRLSDVRLGSKGIVGQELLNELASADATLEASAGDGARMSAARTAKERAAASLAAVIQQQVLDTFGNDPSKAEFTELEIDADPALKYDHVISVITGASGILQGDQVIPLIQKIKFTPPKKG